jgi:hypothetical protein
VDSKTGEELVRGVGVNSRTAGAFVRVRVTA